MDMQWLNSLSDVCSSQTKFCVYLKQFLETQLDWIYTQIASHPDDEYWYQVRHLQKEMLCHQFDFQVNLLLVQLNGLIDGHNNNPRGPRNKIDDPLGIL